VRRRLETRLEKKPYTLRLTLIVSKKRVHKHAVKRNRVKRRIREAFRGVIQRGLQDDGEEAVESEAGIGNWVLRGYEYSVIPNLDVLRCEWPALVKYVRTGLRQVKVCFSLSSVLYGPGDVFAKVSVSFFLQKKAERAMIEREAMREFRENVERSDRGE
jgi:hypothetical protein